jgi:hypothetical protein
MGDDERRAKRSRFDQTEPEPRRSRFDRRSRSPSSRQSDSTRQRSPLSREPRSPAPEGQKPSTPQDPAAAAGKKAFLKPICVGIRTLTVAISAAAAARINAQLQAKRGIHHVEVPPTRSVSAAIYNIFQRRC